MEVHIFKSPDGRAIEFRGNTAGILGMGKNLLFQLKDVPIQGLTESTTRVFQSEDVKIVLGETFFHAERGSWKLHVPVSKNNAESLDGILRSLMSENPVDIPEATEDPVNIGGARRVRTFRTSSKRVSKNGRRLTRKSKHWRQHGEY
jgi:hypothetical protein